MSTHPDSLRFWGILALCSTIAGLSLIFFYYRDLEKLTVDYGDQLTIVGDVYTDKAQAYRQQHPGKTADQLLQDYGGKIAEVWTPRSIRKATFLLGLEYSLLIAALAFGLNLGLEVWNGTWTSKPLAQKPSLQQLASQLKDVHFELNRSTLEQDAAERLSDDAVIVAKIFQQFPTAKIIVEGHGDDRGTVERNLTLGYQRAKAAGDALAHDGIAPDKLSFTSSGKGSSLCSDTGEDCRRKNRRVHLSVVE